MCHRCGFVTSRVPVEEYYSFRFSNLPGKTVEKSLLSPSSSIQRCGVKATRELPGSISHLIAFSRWKSSQGRRGKLRSLHEANSRQNDSEIIPFCVLRWRLSVVHFDRWESLRNSIIYKQVHGCAMGSPVSPVVANLCMEEVEESAISNSSAPPKIWKRLNQGPLIDIVFLSKKGKNFLDT